MRKILTAMQMLQVDAETLKSFSISSHALMEQASMAFVQKFFDLIPDTDASILVLCGTGNNGGDGLAIARLLQSSGYTDISVLVFRSDGKETTDFAVNLDLLKKAPISILDWTAESLPLINEDVIVDALLGIGLNRPLSGELLKLTHYVNQLEKHVIAVDIPTGMPSEGRMDPGNTILKAKEVITFQLPKLNFFLPESVSGLDQFSVVPIGLDENLIANVLSDYSVLEDSDIPGIYKTR